MAWFFLWDGHKVLRGIIGLHVDDIQAARDEDSAATLEEVRSHIVASSTGRSLKDQIADRFTSV